MSKSKNWTKEDIEKIIDERIKIHMSKESSETEDKQTIEELERKLKDSNNHAIEIEENLKSKLSDLNNTLKKKEEDYKERINELNSKISEYQKFDGILKLYQKSSYVLSKYQNTVLENIALDNPIAFMVSISNEKKLSIYHDYIMYEFSNLDFEVISLFNELIEIMCQMNTEYILIDNECQLDDNLHIEKNRKHNGLIKKVLVKGYKYIVSGKAVKKSFVEV